jgi:hypothetical protein
MATGQLGIYDQLIHGADTRSRHRRDHVRATDVREHVPGGVEHPQRPPHDRRAGDLLAPWPRRAPAVQWHRASRAQKPKPCSVQVVLVQCVEGGDRGGAGRVDMGATR